MSNVGQVVGVAVREALKLLGKTKITPGDLAKAAEAVRKTAEAVRKAATALARVKR